MMETKKLQNLG